ncbi:MAG: YafY family protein [Vallitaleaceae bacterium]|jgi:predicted DNA-binding transcriptional regulator YafY|nr:YafY family protein [Vallitaleaceae bacterium]
MQIDRLFQIVYILLEKKQVTAPQLGKMFEVSTRTIYRDIDTLSLAGIPIYAQSGKGGGIRLMDDFVMNKSVLTNKEQNYLLFGLETLKATKYEEVDQALNKLKSIFNKSEDNWLEVDFSYWGSEPTEQIKFENIKKALISCATIEISYRSFSGSMTERQINPLKLVFKERAWYLSAFCLLKADYRLFKVSRITKVKLTDIVFDRKVYDTSHNYEVGTTDLTTYVFNLSKEMKYRVYDEFDQSSIVAMPDGSYNVTFSVTEGEWLYNIIISYGKHIRIIEPEYLRGIIKKRLEETLAHYQ